MELVEQGLVGKRVAECVVLAALGDTERDTMGVIVGGGGDIPIGGDGIILGGARLRDEADAERGEPGIGPIFADHRRGVLAPLGGHDMRVAHIGDVRLGAQLVHGETFGQRRCLVAGDIELEASLGARDDEVEQDLALRCQQARVNGGLAGELLDVVGHDALQQLLGVRASNGDHTPVG